MEHAFGSNDVSSNTIEPDSVRTGWGERYWEEGPAAYLGTTHTRNASLLHSPGLHPAAAQWIVDNRDVKAVGFDTISADPGDSTTYETHQILLPNNVLILENVAHLDEMPPTGSTVYAMPIKIGDGSGAPSRVFAIVDDRTSAGVPTTPNLAVIFSSMTALIETVARFEGVQLRIEAPNKLGLTACTVTRAITPAVIPRRHCCAVTQNFYRNQTPLFRSGWGEQFWEEGPAAYLGTDHTRNASLLHSPGLHPAAAQWIVDNRDVKAVGFDTISADPGDSTTYETHLILLPNNVLILENVAHLDKMPPTGSTVYAMPIKIGDGSGAPSRVFAIVDDRTSAGVPTTPNLILAYKASASGVPRDTCRIVTLVLAKDVWRQLQAKKFAGLSSLQTYKAVMSTATEDVSANSVADENDNFSESVDEVIRLLDELAPGTDDDGGEVTPSSDPEVGREEGTLSGEIVETAPPELEARPPNSYCGERTTVDCCQHREEAESLKKQVEDAKTREDQMAADLKDARAEIEELKQDMEFLKDENNKIKKNNRMFSTSAMQRPEPIKVYSVEAPETQPATYQQTEKKVVASDPDEGGDTSWPGHTGDQQPAPQLFKPAPQPPHTSPQPPPQPYLFAPQPPPQVYQSAPQVYQSAPQVYQSAPQVYQSAPQAYQSAPQVYQSAPQVYPPTPQLYPPTTLQYHSAPQGHPVAEAQRDPVTTHQPPPEESLRFPIQVQDTQKQSDCPVTFKKTTIGIED
ncbi:hypothetical protein Bbelb_092340 [Branchiostoma belcheri]|nr:hypothetical protein Bbelb_092340 [Branchiostoma belcheri]